MPNAPFAEWLVSRFMERTRAASIVGDLLEITEKQGSHAFWFSVAGVVLAITWRHLTAFAAALLCEYLFHAFAMPTAVPTHFPEHGVLVVAMQHSAWLPLFVVLASVQVFLSMAAPYAVVCYGLRDRFAQLTAALCIPITLIFWFWSVPVATITSLVLAGGILIYSVSFALGRRALLALMSAGVLGYLGLRSTLYLSERYLEIAAPSVTRTVIVEGSIPFFVALTVTVACAWTHHLLLRSTPESPELPATATNP